jgi:hypothetical protein
MSDNESLKPDIRIKKDDDSQFPWGEREPEGGFKVGDYVGLIYSDHDNYVFDNPEGVIVDIEGEEPDEVDGEPGQRVTVEVRGSISADRVYLMFRPAPGTHFRSDGALIRTEDGAHLSRGKDGGVVITK